MMRCILRGASLLHREWAGIDKISNLGNFSSTAGDAEGDGRNFKDGNLKYNE